MQLKFKISQNFQNLRFFRKNRPVFLEKNLEFFEIAKGGTFAVECVPNDITS